MLKQLVLSVCLACSAVTFSQKMLTRSGIITFEASMPSFEQIAAKNNTASCIFDTTTAEIAVLALVKGFRFKIPLMEEHFNENYIESNLFPKATFKGKVANFDRSKLTASKSTYDIEGDLTMHGVTKKLVTKINFMVSGDKLLATAVFKVNLTDYAIKIPSIVKSKIAEKADIVLNFELDKKQ